MIDDTRSITIVATDTGGDESGPITALVTVVDRNDGPMVDVGGGDSMDVIMTFVENGPSIPIGNNLWCSNHSTQTIFL